MHRHLRRLIISPKPLVPLLSGSIAVLATQSHPPFLFGRFSGNDDFVAILPRIVVVEELQDPRVGVIGLIERGFESEVGCFAYSSGERGFARGDVVHPSFFDEIVQDLFLPSVYTIFFSCSVGIGLIDEKNLDTYVMLKEAFSSVWLLYDRLPAFLVTCTQRPRHRMTWVLSEAGKYKGRGYPSSSLLSLVPSSPSLSVFVAEGEPPAANAHSSSPLETVTRYSREFVQISWAAYSCVSLR